MKNFGTQTEVNLINRILEMEKRISDIGNIIEEVATLVKENVKFYIILVQNI